MLYNITTGESRQIPPAGSSFDQTNPKIFGNYIVWEDTRDRNPYTDIYLYDLTDGSERLAHARVHGEQINASGF